MNDLFFQQLLREIDNYELTAATFSSPYESQSPAKITVRLLSIKSKKLYQITRFIQEKTFHENISAEECVGLFLSVIPKDYKQCIVETVSASYHILAINQEKLKVKCKLRDEKIAVTAQTHNKTKKYPFPEGIPVPFLVALGIMKSDGHVPRDRYDKFRQINHFIEIIDSVLQQLPEDKTLHIIDFGSGKSYLTFALHYYLNSTKKRPASIIGIDLKKDVIDACQELADRLKEDSLEFVVGDIKDYKPKHPVDMVITLHACNLATDAALVNAIAWNAKVILSVPCCQHELINQVDCKQLQTLLRHGILKERFSALATDAMRAEMLTMAGYNVDVIEFIDMEHTPKNIMIRAVKSPSEARSSAAVGRYQAFKELLSISPWLERQVT